MTFHRLSPGGLGTIVAQKPVPPPHAVPTTRRDTMAPAHTTALPPAADPTAPRLRSFDELPGPRPLPLVGNVLQMRTDRFHRDLEDWARVYGPMMRFRLGPLPVMVV